MPKYLVESQQDFYKNFEKLLNKRDSKDKKIDEVVDNIIAKIIKNSDEALITLTRRLDNYKVKNIEELRVSKKEINDSFNIIDKKVIKALKNASKRIKSYHKRQLPKNDFYKDKIGVNLGSRWTPIDSVGLYVPGGSASYPSSVLMNAIPAIVAGVKRIVMVCPAPGGNINPIIFAVAKILGIDEIYKIGGAQAIATLAFGTKSICKVDKICGPGNAYVASAKKKVFGSVGIDMIAGPSEVLIVADKNNNPSHIAIDLLSQAEHDILAQSILITNSEIFAHEVFKNIELELKIIERKKIASKSWKDFGAIIVIKDIYKAHEFINKIAPEHLEISVRRPKVLLRNISNAGAIFIGKYTPEAIGDYIAGPNHVLPTDKTAKFSSGLSVLDYMKRTSIVECNKNSIKKIGPDAVLLANEEGLTAHANSILKRLDEI